MASICLVAVPSIVADAAAPTRIVLPADAPPLHLPAGQGCSFAVTVLRDDPNAHVYEYDNLYQLIFVDYNDGNSTDYYYDPLGNRSKVDDGAAPVLYDTNCLNQYTAVGPQTLPRPAKSPAV